MEYQELSCTADVLVFIGRLKDAIPEVAWVVMWTKEAWLFKVLSDGVAERSRGSKCPPVPQMRKSGVRQQQYRKVLSMF
jgi:hypothetical protein